MQTIIALGSNVSTEFWSTAGTNPDNDLDEPFLAWLQAVAAQDDAALPHVITISYGDDEWSLSPEYARRVSAEFASLGARGVSILAASGDSGVGGDGTDDNCTRFLPTFPASSPWVTAVGGASFPHDEVTDEPYTLQDEVAWASSGGGFRTSSRARLPERLGAQLPHTPLPPADLYNSTGARAATPTPHAGLVRSHGQLPRLLGRQRHLGRGADVRGHRVAALVAASRPAGPRLGFLNPLLYANPDGLNDIIIGSNPACGAMGSACDDWTPSPDWAPPSSPPSRTCLRAAHDGIRRRFHAAAPAVASAM